MLEADEVDEADELVLSVELLLLSEVEPDEESLLEDELSLEEDDDESLPDEPMDELDSLRESLR